MRRTPVHALIALSFLIAATTVACNSEVKDPEKALVGTWHAQGWAEGANFEFYSDGTCTIDYNGDRLYSVPGVVLVNWYVDAKKKPIHLDIQVEKVGTENWFAIEGVLEFVSNDEVRIQLMPEGQRPTVLADEGPNSMTAVYVRQ